MSRLSWFGFGLAVFFPQASVLPFLFSSFWVPDLWLTAMILTGVIYRPQDMIVMAMAAGMIQDLVMGNFFGLHLFPYLAVAFVMTLGGREKYNRQWFVSMTAVMGGTCLYILAAAAVIWAAGGHIWPVPYLLHQGIPLIMMNGTAAVVMHYVLWELKHERESRW